MVPSPKLGVQECRDLPPKQQPPRGARRKCRARPLSTVNVAGCRNQVICPTSIEHSTSPYVVHGGGPLAGWVPSIQHSLRLKRHLNGAQRSVRICPFMSVTVRRSVDQGWGQVQYLYLVLVLKYIFISTWVLGVWKCQSTCCTCTWPKSTWYLASNFQVLFIKKCKSS